MYENPTSDVFDMIWQFYLMLFTVGFGLFVYQIQDANSFQQHVNYTIERQGGLTAEAMKDINDHSAKFYQGRYKVESDQMNLKVSFGEPVNYKIEGKYEILFIPTPPIFLDKYGQSISQVR